jgi:excisionase family DNA binding protein
MAKVCPICGIVKDDSEYYRTSSYCKGCHKRRLLQYRKQPARRNTEREAKRAWSKRHPEVNRRNVAAWRARQKALRPESSPPADRVTVREAVERLGLTKQRIQQLIDRGQLAAIRVRGRWQIERSALERMIVERQIRSEVSPEAKGDED